MIELPQMGLININRTGRLQAWVGVWVCETLDMNFQTIILFIRLIIRKIKVI